MLAYALVAGCVGAIAHLITTRFFLPSVPWLASSAWSAGLAWPATMGLTFAVATVVIQWLMMRHRPPWIRLGPAGVELAAGMCDAVLIPWSVVAAVTLHGFGPFRRLVVTPTDPDAVLYAPRGAGSASQHRQDGRVAFAVEAACFDSDAESIAASIAAQIRRRAAGSEPDKVR